MARLLIFAKAPVPGLAKTRLIPLLGADGAAEVARRMFDATCIEAQASGLDVEYCLTPAPTDPSWQGLLPGVGRASDQGAGDLGQRLARAAGRTIGAGDWAILVGTDCPALDRHRLRGAAAALEHVDAFIHPAEDGGYALLALRLFSDRLFSGIGWSGPAVTTVTLERIQQLGWTYEVGETLRDVDEPGDVIDCFGAAIVGQLSTPGKR